MAARTLARASADETLLRAWADGKGLPPGSRGTRTSAGSSCTPWRAHGLVGRGDIEAVQQQDDTLQGHLGALTALAALPSAEDKAWAWSELTHAPSGRTTQLNALARGFWFAQDLDVVRPYVSRYFEEVPAMSGWVGEDAIAPSGDVGVPGPGRRGGHPGRERGRPDARRPDPCRAPGHRRRRSPSCGRRWAPAGSTVDLDRRFRRSTPVLWGARRTLDARGLAVAALDLRWRGP